MFTKQAAFSVSSALARAVSTSPYFDIKTDKEGHSYIESSVSGLACLRLPQINKGAAFTLEEREALGLQGLLPPVSNTMQLQLEKNYRRYSQLASPIEKYQYLRELQERNEHLYFAFVMDHLEEMMPIIYTPTVGEACRKYSHYYNFPRGLSFSHKNIDDASDIIGSYFLQDIRMIVATDSSAILGIGDQGYGGMGIPIGKLALYTAAGAVSPSHTCPVALDIGTNRTDLLEDTQYLGVRHKRLVGDEYMSFMEKFVAAVKHNWPKAILQWEDLSKDAAFSVLHRFRDEISSFNDDVQGTGAVTLGGVLVACKAKGQALKDQVVVVSGAGAGGAGVALAIRAGMIKEGLSLAEASKRVLVLDSVGLLYEGRDRMEGYKHELAQPAEVKSWGAGVAPSLAETVKQSGCTVLLGLSGIPSQFDEALVRQMAANTERPIIFCLSNPNANVEAMPEDVFEWTDGKVLIAAGSPFAPVQYNGVEHPIGQGNNAFIFPGLGAGAVCAGAKKITDDMISAGAYALADYTTQHWLPKGRIYPPVSEIRKVNQAVAVAVIKQAIADKVNTRDFGSEDIAAVVEREAWQPAYPTVVPRAFH
eukprot:NODE_678_length_1957_cov_109.398907_g629_i0.p1 GENE.NODE_678_length_1957_cov_109.398907_g629_i0~~NODE_678_length_1957_cov_109.398907_g629_i0.p1  ORF type:complete len:603 (+),score=122.26 NODE_678_length_1957_cov_109.398907_g629_i0:37-1809(+)